MMHDLLTHNLLMMKFTNVGMDEWNSSRLEVDVGVYEKLHWIFQKTIENKQFSPTQESRKVKIN